MTRAPVIGLTVGGFGDGEEERLAVGGKQDGDLDDISQVLVAGEIDGSVKGFKVQGVVQQWRPVVGGEEIQLGGLVPEQHLHPLVEVQLGLQSPDCAGQFIAINNLGAKETCPQLQGL